MKNENHQNKKEIEALRKLSEKNDWKVIVFGKSGESVRGIFCGDEEITNLISDFLRKIIEKGTVKENLKSESE